MCTRSRTSRRHFVCPPCRLSVKRHGAPGRDVCARCGGELVDAGQDLAVPRRRDTAGWRALTALLAAGVTFHSRCCYGPGWRPRTPGEVRERLARSAGGGRPVAEALTTRDPHDLGPADRRRV
ncbi:hypothetical protein ACIF6L_11200 [Kitasatospora sp. NPDC086009]|uniref:hypothetical protein n=1 Tax=unclassified Kitasatospora TaxID=2633591 RepID=UPI0033F97DC2